MVHPYSKRFSALPAGALILTLLQALFTPLVLAVAPNKPKDPLRRVAARSADAPRARAQDLSLPSEAVEAAVVRHAPQINAVVQGSVRQLTGENVALNGAGAITVALLVPGTPTVTLNGNPTFGGTVQGTGSALPSGYHVTLNGSASLGKLVTRTDPIAMPPVGAPPASTGTRNVSLNRPGDSPGDFSTLRDLTVNGNYGQVAVPPGTYRTFTANSGNTFVFGVAGSSQPAVYNLSRLTLDGGSRLQVVGPVLLTIALDLTLNGSAGVTTNPLWLSVNIASGGLTLNSGSTLYGIVRAPSGIVTLNGNSLLHGSVFSDRLTLNSNSVLEGEPGVLDSITPNRAIAGQSVTVTLRGINTHWVQGQTRASLGGEISVGGAAEGDFGPINVIDSTSATAQISASSTAALTPRAVQIQTPIVWQTQVQQENLPNAFTVVAASPPGSPASTVTTLAGVAGLPGFADGPASAARFRDPAGIAIGGDGSIYVADAGNNRIRVVQPGSAGVPPAVSTLAGDGGAGFADGPAASARFNNPRAVAVDASGVVYVADTSNNRIRRIAADGSVTTLAGDGTAGLVNGAGAQARFNAPGGLVLDNQGNIYVADTGNASVRFISINGSVSTVAGDGTIGNGDSPGARFDGLLGVTFDGTRAYAYVADANNHRLRRLDPNGNVITIAGSSRGFGDGSGAQARFADPSGIAVEASTKLVIADTTNSLVRGVDPNLTAAPVVTIAGTGERGFADGSGNQARFFTPRGIAVAQSSAIIVADSSNHVLRKILVPPVINSLAPFRGRAGATVTIDGERFDGRSPDRNTVSFTKAGGGHTQAQVIAATGTLLSVVVPEDAATGRVRVQTEGGTTISSADFEFIIRPVITDFNPKSGTLASIVTISGAGLKSTQGDTVVRFTGAGGSQVTAVVSSSSPTEVRAIVPSGAVTGPITVQTEGGSAATANFEVRSATPIIAAFNPSSGEAGSTVTLTGLNLKAETGPTSVTFAGSGGNRLQALLTFVSPSEVQVIVPNGAVTGVIQLTNALGQAVSPAPFTVTPGQNDFHLTVAPSSTTAVQAGSATFALFLTSPSTTFSQLVSLTATGLPQGASAQFNPQQITAGAVSTLSVRLSGPNPGPGSYSFTIRGSGIVDGVELVRTANASLTVLAPGQTTLSGRVLSTDNEPIMGATVSLDGKTATTDAAGAFLLSGVNAGTARPLMVDGRTASAPNRTYPLIIEPATIVAGQANTVPYTFFLPAIDTQFEVDVVPGQATVATNPRVPELQMTIPADAHLRNRDGSPVARTSITPLAIDRTPAPLPEDVGTNLVYTSQPGGAISDAPMPVIYPNLAGADPGTRIELYAFNHDTVQWYVYGFGRVSPDGRRIEPEVNPQTGRPYGLPDFSWHFPNAAPNGNPGDGKDCPPSRTRHTVDLSTGVKIESRVDLTFGRGRGGIILGRTYTTDLALLNIAGRFGVGTKDNFDIRLTGTFQSGGWGRLVYPEERTGRLYNYARTDPDGSLIFTTSATTGQLGDAVRRLSNGALEHRTMHGDVMRFDSSGILQGLVDHNGNTTTLTYAGGRLTRVTDAVGKALSLAYDVQNRVTDVTDPIGRSWSYAYTSSGLLASVTDPLGHSIRYGYSGVLLTSVTDKRGAIVKRITYDQSSRVIEQRFADGGVESYSYSLSGNVVTQASLTDVLGRTRSKRMNANGYVIEEIDALGQRSIIDRDLITNLPLSTTGPCGCAEVTRKFDERGNVTQITDRLGNKTRFEYETSHNRVSGMTDQLGHHTAFAYDSHGNLSSVTNALGRATTMTYDAFGQLTSATGPLGHTVRVEYDADGNVTAQADGLSHRSSIEYDSIGRPTATVDALGRRTTIQYDVLDRVLVLTNAAGATIRLSYDENGNALTLINALGKQWISQYDEKNRVISSVDPIGRVTSFTYDKANHLVSAVSPSGRTLRYDYDSRGQLLAVTDPLGGVTRFSRDNRGNLTAVTDKRGNTTSYRYDELYRPSKTRDPLGLASTIAYDAASNVVETVDRLNRRTTIDYDVLNRPSRVGYPDATVNYTYDQGSRLTHLDDSQGGGVDWVYDEANRLVSETTPAGTVAYGYNIASQLVSMTAPNRSPVSYGYDSAGRVQTISQNSETFTYSYDALSRRTSLARPNGITTSYSYDDVNRLTRLLHAGSQGQAIEDYGYSYGPDGQITAISSSASANLLPQEKTFGTPDAANRIAQVGSLSLAFDAKGQTVSRSESSGATGYQWDARGRLTRATLPGGQAVDYGYDGLGRLSSRSLGGLTTNFLYSGSEIVLDRASDGSSIDYLGGLGVDEKLRQSSAAGSLYFVQDHLLSVAALTDASGSVVERNQYEPFGNSAASTLTRYGFTGRERDAATGLMYFRARWYDPQQGRFITQDPIGLAGGSNLYAYSANDPINLSDPFGLRPCSGSNPLLDFLGGFFDFGSRFNPMFNQTDYADWREGVKPYFWSGQSPHILTDSYTAATGTVIDRNGGNYRKGEDTGLEVAAGLLTGVVGEAMAESLPGLAAELRGAGKAGSELEGEGAAFEFTSIGREPPPVAEDPGLVIGKLEDLRNPGAVGRGEYTLEWTNQASEKLNWAENSGALREAMREGRPIRDVSVDPVTGDYVSDTGFLRAERELLKSKGWKYDPNTTRWYAPR